jgi:FkbM family methyltransferase
MRKLIRRLGALASLGWARPAVGPGLGGGPYAACRVSLPGGAAFDLVIDRESDDPVARLYREGRYENDYLLELLRAFSAPGDRVLDLGAHIGTFSLAAAALGREVVAVDACPRHVDLLRRSVRRNGFGRRMRVVHAAVSDRGGRLRFRSEGLWGMVALPGMDGAIRKVRATTVDALIARVGWDRVDFVKMDIEGAEPATLRGMAGLLARDDAPVIVYECNGLTLPVYSESVRDLRALLERYGYTSYRAEPGRWIPCMPEELQPEAWLDLVALRPAHAARVAPLVVPPLPASEIVRRAVHEARMPSEVQRGYIARALSQARPPLLDDPTIGSTLDELLHDPDESVRRSAAWWATRRRQAG